MELLESSIDIDADAATVWRVLTDGDAYPEWNPFVTRLDGDLAVGERLAIRVEPPEGRGMSFRPRVTAVEPERHLAWHGSLPIPRLFEGHHEFVIVPRDDGGVEFVQRETFSGLLVPILLDAPDVEAGFQAMNEALERRVGVLEMAQESPGTDATSGDDEQAAA